MRGKDPDQLYELSSGFWPESAQKSEETYKKKVLSLVQERLKYFGELPQLTAFFFEDLPMNLDLISGHKQLKKYDRSKLRELLKTVRDETDKLGSFDAQTIQNMLNSLLESTGEKPVVLFSLIRIAITQSPASPSLAQTMEVLGKDTCLKRIDEQIKTL